MTEKQKMLNSQLYFSGGEQLTNEREKAKQSCNHVNYDWNLATSEKIEIIKSLIGSYGTNFYMETPVRFDYGYNVHVGDNFYMNFDSIFLDSTKITIGDNVMIGPRVSLYTASHPVDKDIRNSLLEYSQPITIGNDVWIGGDTVINPGVVIGSNVVIGSGSVVTRNIASNVLAAGNPCRELRKITDEDKKKWTEIVKGTRSID